jgi:uncharacterized protein YndB with AHSA1/START domain
LHTLFLANKVLNNQILSSMKNDLLMRFSVDKENKKINVEREFAAPRAAVWQAWTTSEMLGQWWAPKPWKARTKSMDFSAGGHWLYAMTGPEGEVHWSRADYSAIVPFESFSGRDIFCDENGTMNDNPLGSSWTYHFTDQSDKTLVSIEISYENLSDLEANLEMGFKEGFTAGMENLDILFQKTS